MPFLQVRVSGIDSFRLKLARLQVSLPGALQAALELATHEVATALSEAAPVGASESSGSDHLSQSFSTEVLAEGSRVVARVVCSQPTKLGYVVHGTGIYGPSGQVITPREKLALYWEGAEHPVMWVRGMEPRDFVTPILNAAEDQAVEEVVSELDHTWLAEG